MRGVAEHVCSTQDGRGQTSLDAAVAGASDRHRSQTKAGHHSTGGSEEILRSSHLLIALCRQTNMVKLLFSATEAREWKLSMPVPL